MRCSWIFYKPTSTFQVPCIVRCLKLQFLVLMVLEHEMVKWFFRRLRPPFQICFNQGFFGGICGYIHHMPTSYFFWSGVYQTPDDRSMWNAPAYCVYRPFVCLPTLTHLYVSAPLFSAIHHWLQHNDKQSPLKKRYFKHRSHHTSSLQIVYSTDHKIMLK
jgi:hypothetical protein